MGQGRRPTDRNRHNMRVELKEGDYDYLKELLDGPEMETWSLNYLVQVIVHRWVRLHAAGHDIGVVPTPGSSAPGAAPDDRSLEPARGPQ